MAWSIVYQDPFGGPDAIPAENLVDWSLAGVPGGIPNRTTIYTTVQPGGNIQAALDACPANQVVLLAAGVHSVSGNLDWETVNNGVVLRGSGSSGANMTTLRLTGGYLYMRSGFNEAALSNDVNLSANAVKGTNTLSVASVPAWLTNGGTYILDQLDDATFVAGAGTEGGASYRGLVGNGARGLGQLIKVTAINGTTLTTECPILYGFSTAQTAQVAAAGYWTGMRTGCGIESMRIEATYGQTDTHMLRMEHCSGCWVYNCVFYNTPGLAHIQTNFSYRCEFLKNEFSYGHYYGGGQAYGIALYHVSTHCKVESNIFDHLHNAMSAQYGSAGNVFAYNFEINGTSDSGQNPGMNTHGVHAYMNLWEGNWCEDKFLGDWTHGSASHQLIFRCRVTGIQGAFTRVDERCCISSEYYNRYNSAVGNILGTTGAQSVYVADSSNQNEGAGGAILKIGGEVNINMDFSPSDANSFTSGAFFLNHGNWNSVQNTVNWQAGLSQSLPNSLYLSGKPAWWGTTLAWPPYSSASPTQNESTRIPAGYKFTNGSYPA